jgi:hypothetical protein
MFQEGIVYIALGVGVAMFGGQEVEQKTEVDSLRNDLKALHTNTTILAARLSKLESDLFHEREKEGMLSNQIEMAEAAVAQERRAIISGLWVKARSSQP